MASTQEGTHRSFILGCFLDWRNRPQTGGSFAGVVRLECFKKIWPFPMRSFMQKASVILTKDTRWAFCVRMNRGL